LYRIVLTLVCSNESCRHRLSLNNEASDDIFVEVTFDMHKGLISYTCPECDKLSIMETKGMRDIIPHRKLGGLRTF
jgi:hypothetical protein